MKLRKTSSEQVLIKNLRRPSTQEIVYLKIDESKYQGLITKELLKQVQWSVVRMKRAKPIPAKNFDITIKYTSEAGDKVELSVPINHGGLWRFHGVPGVKLPEGE